jgi:hypothetical protein
MRALLLWVSLLVFAATTVVAAPTCQNRRGDTVRCEVAEAMPLGWTPPEDEFRANQLSRYQQPSSAELLGVAAGIGLFLILIALLPQFDGSRPEDWDSDERR